MTAPIKQQDYSITSDYIVVIDAGHGSLDKNGKYTTPPDKGKFFDHKDKGLNFHGIAGNSIFYEGVFNRVMANKLHKELAKSGIKSVFCFDEVLDTPLEQRVLFTNQLFTLNKRKVIFLSLHANAGGGIGTEIYTTVGKTASDELADCIGEAIKAEIEQKPKLTKIRADYSDGDMDKEKNFYVIKETVCPAVLLEYDFFDNLARAIALNSGEVQDALISATSVGVINYLAKLKARRA